MYENQMQSRKWQLTINNPQDHGMTHDEIIDRAQKLNPRRRFGIMSASKENGQTPTRRSPW